MCILISLCLSTIIVAPNGLNVTGYYKWNELRVSWQQNRTFDEFFRDKLILSREETKSKKSKDIWNHFEYKFEFVDNLVHYHKFFKETLLKSSRRAIKDGVRILEIRHAFGRIINDNWGKVHNQTVDNKEVVTWVNGSSEKLLIKEELELYKEVISELKIEDPYFEIAVIAAGFKSLRHQHAIEQINGYKYAIENGYDFVTAFDLVNEEDKFEPILYFIDELLEAKQNIPGFKFIFHAGESISRYNENLYDAILLGTKRIGHSIPLTLHPHLMQLVRSNEIGIEVCPVSHWLLGYII